MDLFLQGHSRDDGDGEVRTAQQTEGASAHSWDSLGSPGPRGGSPSLRPQTPPPPTLPWLCALACSRSQLPMKPRWSTRLFPEVEEPGCCPLEGPYLPVPTRPRPRPARGPHLYRFTKCFPADRAPECRSKMDACKRHLQSPAEDCAVVTAASRFPAPPGAGRQRARAELRQAGPRVCGGPFPAAWRVDHHLPLETVRLPHLHPSCHQHSRHSRHPHIP